MDFRIEKRPFGNEHEFGLSSSPYNVVTTKILAVICLCILLQETYGKLVVTKVTLNMLKLASYPGHLLVR